MTKRYRSDQIDPFVVVCEWVSSLHVYLHLSKPLKERTNLQHSALYG